MSLPRQILPGSTYLITRRCTQRMFLLHPTPKVERIAAYALAIAQSKTGVLIHAAVFMSNHYHVVLTDVRGNLPLFTETVNKYIAKCLNALYGRWENVWAANEQPSHVRLLDDAAKLDKIAYTMANPVEGRLVKRRSSWPGLQLLVPGVQKRKRPTVFFKKNGPMPKVATLKVTPVPLRSVERPREVMERVQKAVVERESFFRATYKAAGQSFLGLAAILRQHHTDTPRAHTAKREISPRVASKNKWRRIEMLYRLGSFVTDHARAMCRWVAGERDVRFPAGTYQARLRLRVTCAET